MTAQLKLLDHATRDDLRVYLERLQRAGQAEVRVITRGSVLAVFGCTQAPAGLIDTVPVVLVLRSFALAEEPAENADLTVYGRGLLDRIARMGLIGLTLDLPEYSRSAQCPDRNRGWTLSPAHTVPHGWLHSAGDSI